MLLLLRYVSRVMAKKVVMAGLVPAIHVLGATKTDVDGRHKAGHDGEDRN
jgi:hypothetical protein